MPISWLCHSNSLFFCCLLVTLTKTSSTPICDSENLLKHMNNLYEKILELYIICYLRAKDHKLDDKLNDGNRTHL